MALSRETIWYYYTWKRIRLLVNAFVGYIVPQIWYVETIYFSRVLPITSSSVCARWWRPFLSSRLLRGRSRIQYYGWRRDGCSPISMRAASFRTISRLHRAFVELYQAAVITQWPIDVHVWRLSCTRQPGTYLCRAKCLVIEAC